MELKADRARTWDVCRSFENVFKFICGLSNDVAVKVFEHLTSVRISDPILNSDFKTMPVKEITTDVTLCYVTSKRRTSCSLCTSCLVKLNLKLKF